MQLTTKIINFLTKPYSSLPGYMTRRTLLKLGRLHIRIHRLHSDDATPFLHSHPFHYVSFILKGGYFEEDEAGALREVSQYQGVAHSHTFFHRIVHVAPGTLTLFMTWETKTGWQLKKSRRAAPAAGWVDHIPGIYEREMSGKKQFSKFNEFWFKGHETLVGALAEVSPSINQKAEGIFICGLE